MKPTVFIFGESPDRVFGFNKVVVNYVKQHFVSDNIYLIFNQETIYSPQYSINFIRKKFPLDNVSYLPLSMFTSKGMYKKGENLLIFLLSDPNDSLLYLNYAVDFLKDYKKILIVNNRGLLNKKIASSSYFPSHFPKKTTFLDVISFLKREGRSYICTFDLFIKEKFKIPLLPYPNFRNEDLVVCRKKFLSAHHNSIHIGLFGIFNKESRTIDFLNVLKDISSNCRLNLYVIGPISEDKIYFYRNIHLLSSFINYFEISYKPFDINWSDIYNMLKNIHFAISLASGKNEIDESFFVRFLKDNKIPVISNIKNGDGVKNISYISSNKRSKFKNDLKRKILSFIYEKNFLVHEENERKNTIKTQKFPSCYINKVNNKRISLLVVSRFWYIGTNEMTGIEKSYRRYINALSVDIFDIFTTDSNVFNSVYFNLHAHYKNTSQKIPSDYLDNEFIPKRSFLTYSLKNAAIRVLSNFPALYDFARFIWRKFLKPTLKPYGFRESNKILVPLSKFGSPVKVDLENIDILFVVDPWHDVLDYSIINKNVFKIGVFADVIPIIYPYFYNLKVTNFCFESIKKWKSMFSNFDLVLTYSNHAIGDIYNMFSDIKPDVVNVGVPFDESRYHYLKREERNKVKIELSKKYSFDPDRKVILSVARVEPRKNFETVVRFIVELKKHTSHPFNLLVLGNPGLWSQAINEIISKNGGKWLGYVPEDDLVKFYQISDLFIYPSLYEGWGMPPQEAMACGTPVITSNVTSLPEATGYSAFYFDPYDVDGMVQKAIEILNWNESELENYRRKSLKAIEKYKFSIWSKNFNELILEKYNNFKKITP